MCAACVASSALFSVASTVNAVDPVEYTFTPEETAALFGYTSVGDVSVDNSVAIWDPDGSGQYAHTSLYSTVVLDGIEYIAVRVYMWRDAIVERRDLPAINISLQTSVTLDNMYDFRLGGGCVTGNTTASTYNDELRVRYYDNGVSKSCIAGFGNHYTITAGTWKSSGSATNAAVVTVRPDAVSTSPSLDIYTTDTSVVNYQLKLTAPGYVSLADDAVTDYGDCYAYVLFRCPTVWTDPDSLVYIRDTLDSVAGSLDLTNQKLDEISDQIEESNSLLSDLKEGITNVVDSVTSLPGQIWDYISTGLHDLFIPDEEAITTFKTDMESLFDEHFGALYDSVELIDSYVDQIQVVDPKDTITFPTVELDLGAPFVIGGWEVQVVPDGFDYLIESLKFIIDAICTLAFVNTLRSKFDDLLVGGEQNVD